MPASNLSKFLVNPSRVASIFDWKKAHSSIMCLDIRKHSIGVAVARHPHCQHDDLDNSGNYTSNYDFAFDHHDSQHIDKTSTCIPKLHTFDIAFPQRPHERNNKSDSLQSSSLSSPKNNHICINNSTKQMYETLESIVNEYQVCAFVVHWPLSVQGCRIGEKCGTVLHKLDQLVSFSPTTTTTKKAATTSSSSNRHSVASSKSYHTANRSPSSSILSENRPFALVVPEKHVDRSGRQQKMVVDKEDMWGRNSNLSCVESNPRPVQFSSKKGVTLFAFDNGDNDGDELCLPALVPRGEEESSVVAARILNQFLFTHWSEDIMSEKTAFDNFHRRIDCDDEMDEMMNA